MASSIHWKIILLTACLCWSSCLSQNPEEDLLAFVKEAVQRIKDMAEKVEDLRERLDGLNESQMAVHGKVDDLRERLDGLNESQMAVHGKVEEIDDKFTAKFGELQKIERSIEGCSSVEQQLSNLTMVLTKDDCAEGSHCCSPLAVCEDAIVSYRCICLPGTTGDGFTCEDVDECASDEDRCHDHAQCRNIIGNYTCACNPGFDGDGFNCRDVDECASGEDRCHDHAECRNIIGNYTCACNPGFDGDGFNCREALLCVHPYVTIPGIRGCLVVVREKKTWLDAARHCNELGGRLLEGWDSNTQSELISDYVNKALSGKAYEVWVGAHNRRWPEGKADVPSDLFYLSSSPVHYSEDGLYGYLRTYYKRLWEYTGSSSLNFICQRISHPSSSSSSSSFSST